MDFKNYLKLEVPQIEKELDTILSEFLNQTKNLNAKLLPFALGLVNSCKGGKRIRGTLTKLGYEIASLEGGRWKVEDGKEVFKIAAALEILHSAILIHDDIMDQSPIRRGKKTLYKLFGDNHQGISQAINVGDIGFYLSSKIIADSLFPAELKIKAISHLSQTIIDTGWGQIMDVELGEREKDIEFININKTAKYTIAGPLQIGAILAGAEERVIRELGVFGKNAGVAFQIQDDILDGEVEVLEESEKAALKYKDQAKKIIPSLTKDPKMSTLLSQLAEYLVERQK